MASLAGLTGIGDFDLDVGRELWELSTRDCEEDSCAGWSILMGIRDL